MNDKLNDIFKVLGVEPNEPFILHNKDSGDLIYKLDANFNTYYLSSKKWHPSNLGLAGILRFEITKIPVFWRDIVSALQIGDVDE